MVQYYMYIKICTYIHVNAYIHFVQEMHLHYGRSLLHVYECFPLNLGPACRWEIHDNYMQVLALLKYTDNVYVPV